MSEDTIYKTCDFENTFPHTHHIVIEDNEVKIVYYLSLRVVTFEIIGEAF